MPRSPQTLTALLNRHLSSHNLQNQPVKCEVRPSKHGGFGLFATVDLEPLEVIFRDAPILLGPRFTPTLTPFCAACHEKRHLDTCRNGCGLQLCQRCAKSTHYECEIIKSWTTSEPTTNHILLLSVLTPIRSLLLSDTEKHLICYLKAHKSPRHGKEVDLMLNQLNFSLKQEEEAFMRLVCAVLDANAFETLTARTRTSLRGLYPVSSMANHSCSPNTSHVFDGGQNMVVQAVRAIPAGSELFHSYSRLIWSTPVRRLHLERTKHFTCRCERCEDPTEFGSLLSAIVCKWCEGGVMLPVGPQWRCETCQLVVRGEEVGNVLRMLASALDILNGSEVEVMLRFLEVKLPQLAPGGGSTAVEVKYRLLWILGHREGFGWGDLTERLLQLKIGFCGDLLRCMAVLRLGQCKMRGLVLYELYGCLKELKKRGLGVGTMDLNEVFEEVANIRRFDATAPEDVKAHWMRLLESG